MNNQVHPKFPLKKTLVFAALACGLAACTTPQEAEVSDTAVAADTDTVETVDTTETVDTPETTAPIADGEKLRITTTINMLTDMAQQIGGERVEVTGLMGAGVDPHLYKASAGDVQKLSDTDMVLYGGHHLEGKMVELLEDNPKALAVMEALPEDELIHPEGGFGNVAGMPDPHTWFDVSLWKQTIPAVRDAFIEADPAGEELYTNNAAEYMQQLEQLDSDVQAMINEIPEDKRVLVTAHDAFNYYGRRYGLEVKGVQGLSTATEAGTKDVQDIANFMVERGIPAIFVESSVPRRTVDAVVQAAAAQGHTISIGGELFSDAMGEPGTPGGTYIGMVTENTKTISEALKQ